MQQPDGDIQDTSGGHGRPAGAAGPATPKQEALWFLERLVPGSGANNLSVAFRVAGRLQPAALQATLTSLLNRYEVLRTIFRPGDTGLTREILAPGDIAAEVEPIHAPGGDDSEVLKAFIGRPFELEGQPLLRAGLLGGPLGDVCCLVIHHLIFDAMSVTILLRDFIAIYDAIAAGHQPPAGLLRPVPALAEGQPGERSLAFWREHLRGFDPGRLDLDCGQLDLPQPTLTGDQVSYSLSAATTEAVRGLRKRLRSPESVILFAAFYLLLVAHGAGPDLVVGSPVNTRKKEDAGAIGYHISVAPLRMKIDSAQSFRQLVTLTRTNFLQAMEHGSASLDDFSAELPRNNSSWRDTIFRHLFNYLPGFGSQALSISGMKAEPVLIENGFSKFDLEFFVSSSPESIWIRAVYYTAVLGRTDVELLLERYEALLQAISQDTECPVGELTAWGTRDTQVIAAANRTEVTGTAGTVLAAIAGHVAASPDAVAVSDGPRTVDYGQLWSAALAARDLLRKNGVRRGDVVAVAAVRSAATVAAVLGTWLAGAACVPVDAADPAPRIAAQLADSGARVVLTEPGAVVPAHADVPELVLPPIGSPAPAEGGRLPAAATEQASLAASPDAYLSYAWDTDGRARATMISHGGLANSVMHFAAELGGSAAGSTLWLTPLTGDVALLELLVPLVSGGRVAVAPDGAAADGLTLAGTIQRDDVAVIHATPAAWRQVLPEVAPSLAGRQVICWGEPLSAGLAESLLAAGCRLHHPYGSAETGICALASQPAPGTASGRQPIRNTRAFVLGRGGRELPIGVSGELCIAGRGVSRGYRNRPELTAARFGTHTTYGPYFRTGQLARWQPDGTVQLLGRAGRPVRLRNRRVEPAAIERVLLEHPDVDAAAVVTTGDPGADEGLVAFAETPDPARITGPLREHARARLPRWAVPAEFVAVAALPRAGDRELEYDVLTALAADLLARRSQALPAADEDGYVEDLIAFWRELLGRGDIDASSNFFACGGHSLLAAQLAQRVTGLTGVRLRLADVFDHPTPAGLAAFLRAACH